MAMKASDIAARDAITARLAQSRAEISRLLEPPPPGEAGESAPREDSIFGGFPRSRTMRALMTGRGLGAVGALAGGLLLARPALAWRLIRLLPTSAVTRLIVARVMSSLRGKSAQKE